MLASTMLTIIGFLMVAVIVYCLMQSKTTPVPVFAIIPVIAILIFNLFSSAGLLTDLPGIVDLVKNIKGLAKADMFTHTARQLFSFLGKPYL